MSKARRRWLGAMCVVAAIGMLLGGDTEPGGSLGRGFGFVAYWLLCFVLSALALCIALLDARALRRETRDEQRALFESALRQIDQEKRSRRPQDRQTSDR